MPNEQLRQWLNHALQFVPDNFGRDELREYLQEKLSRCRAKTPEGFSKWVLLQLAKHDGGLHAHPYLKLPKSPVAEPELVQNGQILLIKIGDTPDGSPIIWKVPALAMDFVREHWPVYPKRVGTGYAVYVARDGKDFPLHKRWLNAEEGDHVRASDGDFLNWCDVKARVIVEPVFSEGVACIPGNTRSAEARVESERLVSNLYVVSDSNSPYRSRHRQAKFERSLQQPSQAPEGGRAKIYPNSVWRAGVFGKAQDCGKFSPWDSADEPNRDRWNEKGPQPEEDAAGRVRRIQQAWGIGTKYYCLRPQK